MFQRRQPIELPPVPEGADRPTILARVYPGYHEQAVELFQQDAELLAEAGYFPVGQSYAEGRYASGYVLLVTLLVLVGIGIEGRRGGDGLRWAGLRAVPRWRNRQTRRS